MYKSLYGLLLASTAAVSPLMAQDVPFEANAVYLGTLTLTSENPEDVAINSDDLERSNPGDLADIFKTEPSISVGSSIPMSQKIYVNGVEEVNLAVSIDGARQNNRIFHHMSTTIIDPDLLKAVRVDPGVAPADAGPAALAGSIAWETKDVADLLDAGDNFGGSANLEWNSNGSVWSRSGTVYGRTDGAMGSIEALAFLKFADGDNRTDGDGDDITGSGTNLTSGLAKLAWVGQGGDRLELSYERVADDADRPQRANIGAVFVRGVWQDGTRDYDIERENMVLTYTDETPTDYWDPTIRLAYNDTELENDDGSTITSGRTNSFNALIQNKMTFDLGDVTTGFDYYRNEAELKETGSSNYQTDETLINYGLFAQARLVPVDGLNVSFGGRVDFQDFEGLTGHKEDASGLSGNISVSYDVNEFLTVSAGYSDIWGGIQLGENYVMNPAWTYDEDGIDPVRAKNKFIAADIYAGAFSFDLKFFETEIEDARTASWNGGPNLTSDMTSEGYELGASYSWGDGFARLAYANIDTTVNDDVTESYYGNYLTMPLGEEVVLQAEHDFAALGLRVGGDVQWVLENSDVYEGGQTLEAYKVANIWADYTPKSMDTLLIRAEINNLFDETYAARATYGQDYDSVVPLYEPGRSFVISATYKF